MNKTPILAFASGKGGVGKTSLCMNIATVLANQGKKILVLDGDFGLGNANVQLNLTPEKDLSHVLKGTATLAEIIVKTEQNFWLIPGRSGASNLPFINQIEQHDILEQLNTIAPKYDAIFIDVPAGLDSTVLSLCTFADTTIVIATPDPSSITDAYALIKLLHQRHDCHNAKLVVNQAGNQMEGKHAAKKIITAAKTFLDVTVPQIGQIPYDRTYAHAIKTQTLPVESFPNSKPTLAIEELAGKLI